jgi:hypothetical protein
MKALILLMLLSANSYAQCGTERRPAKTLSDGAVLSDSVYSTRVAELVGRKLTYPGNTAARTKDELQRVTVDALLVGFKVENGRTGDNDFHIVIADPLTKETMICEIPSENCVTDTTLRRIFKAERTLMNKKFFTPTAKFRKLLHPVPIRVIFAVFIDHDHGQTGVAKNAVEGHPVLDISFP